MEHSEFWIDSTSSLGDFSDGLSQTLSIRPWDREVSNIDQEYTLSIELETSTTPQLTLGIEGSFEDCMYRFLGCFVVGTMPKPGLHEAIDSLRNIWSFYTEAPPKKHPQIQGPSLHTKVAGKENRPDLVLR